MIYHASVQASYYQRYLPEFTNKATFITLGFKNDRIEKSFLSQPSCGDYVVSVGFQDRRIRDWDTLLRAFARFSEMLSLKIVGKRNLKEGRDISRGLTVPKNVELLGPVYGDKFDKIILGARLVILPLPEKAHALGQLTLLHAMALGKCVIVSYISGIMDYVQDGETAVCYVPVSVESLTEKTQMLLQNPSIAEEIGQKARIAVSQRYSFNGMVENIYKVVVDATKGVESAKIYK